MKYQLVIWVVSYSHVNVKQSVYNVNQEDNNKYIYNIGT